VQPFGTRPASLHEEKKNQVMFHGRLNGFLLLWSLAVWLAFCHPGMVSATSPATQSLSSGWQLARVPDVTQTGTQISAVSFNSSSWIDAVVPGTALASYQIAGLIADPYFGTNMAGLEDSGYYDTYYWYRDTFYVPGSYAGQKIWLNFNGINWEADVYVNGSYVDSIPGPFTRGKFDITSLVSTDATNCVAVLLHWSNATVWDSPAFIAADGWDFMPPVAGRDVGIYQGVYLSTSASVSIIDPFVATTLPLPNTSPARLAIQVGLTNSGNSAVNGTLSGVIMPDGINFQTNVTIPAAVATDLALGPGQIPQLSLSNPALWWPNGYGPQSLHSLQLSFLIGTNVSDVQTVNFGIRQYSYNTNGHDLQLSCNGQLVLCKGGNWGMPDAMLKYTDTQLDTAIRLHKEMNFTMIRAWHGTSDLEGFYDACDKYGIMVWDEFWLNGSNFGLGPDDPNRFEIGALDKIRRLRNRACLAVWCGENEATPPATLNTFLSTNISQLDGTRIYFPASNAGGIHGGGPYAVQAPEWYFSNAYGFTTEIGLPSIPPVESMQAMMPAASLWPLGDTNWGLHDWATDIGNKGLPQYTNAVSTEYGAATNITDFCEKAQLLNLSTYKAIFEAWNAKLFNDGSGVLLWMSQPAWPSTIWQTYDWYFEVGGAYFGCKKGCEPVHIQWDCADNSVRVINATAQPLTNVSAGIQVYNLDGALEFSTNIPGINLAANSLSNCFTLFNAGDNLSLHQPVYASSIDNTNDAIPFAVDGNLSTRWSSAYSDPQWFYVDLGSTQSFDTVTILWETAYASAFQIQVSNDATNWTTVWSTNGMMLSASGGWSTSSFSPASGRYVRMYGTQRATIWGYSMFEFQVYNSMTSWITNLSSVHFIKLKLTDARGNLLSDNFYWRGTNDLSYSALSTLPSVSPLGSASYGITNGTTTITANLTNPSSGIAFAIRLQLLNASSGARVLPTIYSDNYFSLLPGESKVVTIEFTNDSIASGSLQLVANGWNIPRQTVLDLTVNPALPAISPPAPGPANVVTQGTTMTLTCSNWSGMPPYDFQWQTSAGGGDYVNVPGATTNTLAFGKVTTFNSGYYRLAFAANGQWVTSSVASLSVSTSYNIAAAAAPRLSVKCAADKNWGYDAINSGFGTGALGTEYWFNLYGPDGASNGVSQVPFYSTGGIPVPSGAVLVYNYAGEVNYINEQTAQPNNLALMDSFILVNNGWYLSVTNLDRAFTNGYDLYFYYNGGVTGWGGQNYIRYYAGETRTSPVLGTQQWNLYTTATNNDGHFTQDLTPMNSGVAGETLGANYLVFTNLSGGAFDLLLTNGNYAGLNAFEVVAAVPPTPIQVAFRWSGGGLTLEWPNGILLQATNLTGPWATNNGSSPYVVPMTNSQMFYRTLVQ
jgi:hypothetical protein